MKLSSKIKRRIKVGFAIVVLLGGMYLFALLGAGAFAVGLGMVCLAFYYRLLWPEVWTVDGEIHGKRQNYFFVGILIVAGVVLLMGLLYQSQIETRPGEVGSVSEQAHLPRSG